MVTKDEGKLVEAGLLCDVCRLKSVLSENTEWFRDIRGMNRDGCGKRGIRDVLEHHSSSIEIHRESANEGPWRTRALLHYVSECNPMSLDLLVLAEKLISQLCALWTELYRILPLPRDSEGYRAGANMREGDIYFVLGDDMDVTRLWPPI